MGMKGWFQGNGKNGSGQPHSRTKSSSFPGNQPLARAPPTALDLVEKRTWEMQEDKDVVGKQMQDGGAVNWGAGERGAPV